MPEALVSSRGVDQAARALAALLERLPRRRPVLAILTYHRVAPAGERPDLHPGLRTDPAAFAAQVALLAERADPVSIDDILAAGDGGPALPPRAVHVTIDDGYSCVEEHAWPVLREAGVPATLFVPTAHPGSDRTFWWDDLHHALSSTRRRQVRVGDRTWATDTPVARRAAFAQLRQEVVTSDHAEAMRLVDAVAIASGTDPAPPATSTWDGLRAMADEGLALAPHSRTHPMLTRVPEGRLRSEVAGSWDDLRRRVGDRARPVFAPPGGGHDARVLAAAHRAGLRLVVTTDRGVNAGGRPGRGPLRRINVGPRSSTGLVRIQLCPQAHAVRARVSASTVARRSSPWS